MRVTQISRQQVHAFGDVDSGAVPVEEGVDGEGVAQVVKPGSAARRTRLQTNAFGQFMKDEGDVVVSEPSPDRGDEEGRRSGPRHTAPTMVVVVAQCLRGGWMQHDLT